MALAGLTGAAPAVDRCAALARISLPTVTIETAQSIAGRFEPPGGASLATEPVCRVRGIARPTPASRVTFELWLPRSGWTGRYYQLGNGGFAGNIHHPSLAAEAARGNAAAITDTGHSGSGLDADWALGRPDLVADYGHRSIKATSDAARALIGAYYGRPARFAYFAGCSNGGRQGLMAAQRYPAAWDGILACAPANFWTRQLAGFAAIQRRLRVRPDFWLPAAKLPAIQRAALAACRPGSVNGEVATDPESCRFDPAALICRGAEADDCLTAGQAETLRLIRTEGFEPTAAASPASWTQAILESDPEAGSQLRFATEAFRFLFGAGPGWRAEDYDLRRHRIPPAVRAAVDADAVDLSRFRDRGGRILSYIGWADPLFPPHEGLAYYRRVARRMGGTARTQAFYRLFMVPGMTHCQGGLGADSFGQSMVSPPLRADPAHDIRLALEAWVERGLAPDTITAVRFRDGDPAAGIVVRHQLRPAR